MVSKIELYRGLESLPGPPPPQKKEKEVTKVTMMKVILRCQAV